MWKRNFIETMGCKISCAFITACFAMKKMIQCDTASPHFLDYLLVIFIVDCGSCVGDVRMTVERGNVAGLNRYAAFTVLGST
jgi:hypothetical protein